jgi:hypothetical protein
VRTDTFFMNYYYLGERDQSRSSWVLFELVKAGPKHFRNPELPPVMYQFFGPQPEGEMRMKPEYLPLCCKTCGRYDDDPVFEVGFKDPVTIRIKGDFSHTQDRVFVVNEKFLSVVQKAKIRGYETKPVGKSGWHAFRATERVDFAERVMKLVEPFCPECKRAQTTTGMFEHLSQLDVPNHPNTFFTTKRGWPTMLWDRWIFAAEDVVKALKQGGIKGGYFNRLWTDEEVRMAEEKAQQGNKWKPPGITVLL